MAFYEIIVLSEKTLLISQMMQIIWKYGGDKTALQSKNAVCAFRITYKQLSFVLEDYWRN